MISLGLKNYIEKKDISSIIEKKNSRPLTNFIQHIEKQGKLINLTNGKAVKSIIITKSGWVYLSPIGTDTMKKRYREAI